MVAGVRFRFLLSFAVALTVACCLPAQAQAANGVPPSVTSVGFGGRFVNGIQPGVTSLGPNFRGGNTFGNCCANYFFWPSNTSQPANSRHHHRGNGSHNGQGRDDRGGFAVGVLEPGYIPYPVAYASGDAGEDNSADADAGQAPVLPSAVRRPANRSAAAEPEIAEEPVTAQPATVLVFKDGHESDVLNYAIVGNTLFDFEADRTRKIQLADLDLTATRKANDDRGVDFEIPAVAAP